MRPYTVVSWFVLLAAPQLSAQQEIGRVEPYGFWSRTCDLSASTPAVVAHHMVARPGATFLTLELTGVELGAGSRLEIESMLDHAVQVIRAESLQARALHTAYFNGDLVQVRLIAGPHTQGNRFGIRSIGYGVGQPSGVPADLCGSDDRQLGGGNANCRLLTKTTQAVHLGSAFLIDHRGWLLTAGSNVSMSGVQSVTAQFDVPQSDINGNPIHPPPTNQFDWDTRGAVYEDGPTGNWGMLRLAANSTTDAFAGEWRSPSRLGPPPPPRWNIDLTAHGRDDARKPRSYVLVQGAGTLGNVLNFKLYHDCDSPAGSQGGRLDNGQITFGIDIGGTCSGTVTNEGWSLGLPNLDAAIQSACSDAPNLLTRRYAAPTSGMRGGPYSVSFQVANMGRNQRDAAACRLGVYLSTDARLDPQDLLLTTVAVPTIVAGSGWSSSAKGEFPRNLAPGKYWIGVFADDESVVSENDETDNATGAPITIQPGQADLVADLFAVVAPDPVDPGALLELEVVTRNVGDISALPTRSGIVLHKSAQEQYVLGWVDVPQLWPQQSHKRTIKVAVPWCATGASAVPLVALADLDGTEPEKDESNNSGSNRLTSTVREFGAKQRQVVFDPRYPTIEESSARMSSTDGADVGMCVFTPDPLDQRYLLLWSAQADPFAYDAFSGFVLTNLNSPFFVMWFGTTNPRLGARPRIRVPALATPLALTVHTHVLFFDAQMGVRGFGTGSIENVITR